MSENFTIYHNPRCSKSRQTLALLEENGIQPKVVLYLDTRLSKQDLQTIISRLKISPRELLRTGEDAYKELNLSDTSLSDEELISAMLKAPKLIERPIVTKGKKAVLGRPPENVLSLL